MGTYSLLLLSFFAEFLALLWLLRRDKLSLGLPLAYIITLAINHVPGAAVYAMDKGPLDSAPVQTGFMLTTIGAGCFVVGAWLAHTVTPAIIQRRAQKIAPLPLPPARRSGRRRRGRTLNSGPSACSAVGS